METQSVRITKTLYSQAKRKAMVENRSIKGQLEHWAKLGKIIASKISTAEAMELIHGLKVIGLDTSQSSSVDTGTVLHELETDRKSGFSGKSITSAPFYFEASVNKPGFLDRVDSATGERETGRFHNGKFLII